MVVEIRYRQISWPGADLEAQPWPETPFLLRESWLIDQEQGDRQDQYRK
jgi:hypothetical protein